MIIYDLENTLKKAFVMEYQMFQSKENDESIIYQPLIEESYGLVEVQDYSPYVPLNIKDMHISQNKGKKKKVLRTRVIMEWS